MERPSKAKAIERLQKVLKEIPALMELERGSSEFEKWHRNTKVAIEKTFLNEPSKLEDFLSITYSLRVVSDVTPDSEFQRAYVRGLEKATARLESMIEEIQEYWEDEHQQPKPPPVRESRPLDTKEIFIVHGRDEEAAQTVARFLDKLGLSPVILHEKPSQGRTIIEKFEHHAKVGFAVVLLTPDDVGASQGNETNLKPRARQNVIFEFGYFIGRLGRNRVCALTKGNVEIPSDYDGVIYIPLDEAGGWKMKLVKELKDAGIDVDANRAFRAS